VSLMNRPTANQPDAPTRGKPPSGAAGRVLPLCRDEPGVYCRRLYYLAGVHRKVPARAQSRQKSRITVCATTETQQGLIPSPSRVPLIRPAALPITLAGLFWLGPLGVTAPSYAL
jgi:hypothetical protein